MKAVTIKENSNLKNSFECMELIEILAPIRNTDDIEIDVCAAGMNRADILQRKGLYPPPIGASNIMGLEVSGTNIQTGEKICALLAGGGYASKVFVHPSLCLPAPSNIPLEHAAALPEAVATCYRNLIDIAALQTGEHLLIHGGASGIGTMAIQIAKFFGAKVTVTAGSSDRCAKCLALGADFAFNYKTEFPEGAFDVVLDMAGGETLTKTLPLLNDKARYISIAYLAGANAMISIPIIMKKQIMLTGSTLRSLPLVDKIDLINRIKNNLWPAVLDGRIKPVIDQILPLADAARAHEIFEKGQHFGKILLKI